MQVEGNVLHIKGEKKVEKEVSEDDRYMRECRYGSFRRDMMLPEGVSSAAITAVYDNGILTVDVPLPKEAVDQTEPKKIMVEIAQPEPVSGT